MLPRFLVAVCLGTAFVLAGCGGSSSETPWPLEPDIRFTRAQDEQSNTAQKKPADDAAETAPTAPPDQASKDDYPSTWGSSQEPDELTEP
jgi:hypothetical protein